MKKLLLLLTLVSTLNLQASENEIMAKVIFENWTGKELISGKFFITELNQTIQVNTEDSFTITLPKKGHYQFGFYSEDFECYTYYPARINSKKNIITIRLENKAERIDFSHSIETPLKSENSALLIGEEIKRMPSVGMNFIFNGISNLPIDFTEFKNKYGIGIVTKNCVVDPITFKTSIEHNRYIVDYLNKNYGEEWKRDLPSKPFGVK